MSLREAIEGGISYRRSRSRVRPHHQIGLSAYLIPCRRIRSLETSVDDLRNGQREMQSSLKELLGLLRHGSLPPSSSTPTSFTAGMGSPSASVSSGGQASMEGVMPHGGETLPPINHQVNGYAQRGLPIPRPPTRESYMHPSSYGSHSGPYYSPTTSKLPPISTIHNQGSHPHSHPHNTFSHHLPAIDHPGSNSRYGPGPSYRDADHSSRRPMSSRSNKRGGNNSNVPSTNSSSDEADDGEINASGLVAPLEVLRGLADEAVKRSSRVSLSLVIAASFTIARYPLLSYPSTTLPSFRTLAQLP
jgi:hypothetical protein